MDISLQSWGHIWSDEAAACGKCILSVSATQLCYTEVQWINYEFMSLVAQLPRSSDCTRISQ